MTPKVSLRQALEDPSLLGTALARPSWHAWRPLLLATMGEPLNPDELKRFVRIKQKPPRGGLRGFLPMSAGPACEGGEAGQSNARNSDNGKMVPSRATLQPLI